MMGLELGLLTMKKGEFSRFLFQPQYAYGDIGCPPFIPGAATVLYEVHILDYLDSAQVDDVTAMSPVGKLLYLTDPEHKLCIFILVFHEIEVNTC